jgi:hypothetical protein
VVKHTGMSLDPGEPTEPLVPQLRTVCSINVKTRPSANFNKQHAVRTGGRVQIYLQAESSASRAGRSNLGNESAVPTGHQAGLNTMNTTAEECRLLGYKNAVLTSQETHCLSATEPSRLMLCKI